MSSTRLPAHTQLLQTAAALHRAGRLGEAVRAYSQVLVLDPDNADALNLLGVAAQQQGNASQALSYFDKAISAAPDLVTAHYNKGHLLVGMGQQRDAAECYRRAIALAPTYADPQLNLGALLFAEGNLADAIETFQKMVAACPNDARGHFNLSRGLAEAGRVADAELALLQALDIKPDYVDALITLAKLYADTDRIETAVSTIRKAIAISPANPLALTNLGTYLTFLDEHEAALDLFSEALRVDPAYVSATVNRGIALLTCGQLAEGWDAYWSRADTAGSQRFRKLDLPWPRWEGQPLNGKSIFVWGEQGLGDEILYASMIPDIVAEGASCMFGCDGRLVSLFQRSFPTIDVSSLPSLLSRIPQLAFDFQTSIVDIGRWRRRSIEAFPLRQAYLIADPKAVSRWRDRWAARFGEAKPKIGFSWRSLAPHIGASKTPPLDRWGALLSNRNAVFFNLQYGKTPAIEVDVGYFRERFGCELNSLGDPGIAVGEDIDELAAQVGALDSIISVSNTTAHLSGALGKATQIVVPEKKARLWYWFKEGSRTPWYPCARILRWAQEDPPDLAMFRQ